MRISSYLKVFTTLLPIVAFLMYYNLQMEAARFEPYLSEVIEGKELVTKLSGDPDITFDSALTVFYNAARALKLSPSYITAHHSSWRQRETIPQRDWVIYYTRRIPETATSLAGLQQDSRVQTFFNRRNKTTTAEILHVGRYEDITESLGKLRRFMTEQGYRPSGFYEEVFLKFDPIESNPYQHETLLRYQVARLE